MEFAYDLINQNLYHIFPCVEETENTSEVMNKMTLYNMNIVYVVDKKGTPVGEISQKNFKKLQETIGYEDQRVTDAMSKNISYAYPETQIETCLQIMIDKKINFLPIAKNNNYLCVISIDDALNALITEKNFEINQLHRFIRGDI